MLKNFNIKPPFFEIGPKAYLYGEEMLKLVSGGFNVVEVVLHVFAKEIHNSRKRRKSGKEIGNSLAVFHFSPHLLSKAWSYGYIILQRAAECKQKIEL